MKKIVDSVISAKCERVGIQVPEGLKKAGIELANLLVEKGLKPVIITEPCFGACDLADWKAEAVGCGCLIQVGHAEFMRYKREFMKDEQSHIPVFFYEYPVKYDLIAILEKGVGGSEGRKIRERKLGLVSTVQHIHEIPAVKKFLISAGYEVKVGERGIRTKYRGHILGCDISGAEKIAKDVDAFILLGSGEFHTQELLKAGKKVYRVDYITNSIEIREKEPLEKRGIAKVLKYAEEEKWGILISVKSGQLNIGSARKIKRDLESLGKRAYMFVGDRILEKDLVGFGIKIFVNTACPRLVEDFKEVALVNPEYLRYLKEYLKR